MFMGIWVIVFSYLKLLNPKGFVRSFQQYDFLSQQISWWAWTYPGLEALLGLAFLLPGSHQRLANQATLLLASLQTVQVVFVLYQGRKLECACMGSLGFDLPLSTVTLTENIVMILMAALMMRGKNDG